MLKQHILVELKQFIQYVSSYRGGNPKTLTSNVLVRTSLHLLEDLPAAREIVFEYFALVAEVGVQSYVNTANVDPQTGVGIQPPKLGTSQQQQQQLAVSMEDRSLLRNYSASFGEHGQQRTRSMGCGHSLMVFGSSWKSVGQI